MFIQLFNKSLLSSILVMLFVLGGMCKCILTNSDCYLDLSQEEVCSNKGSNKDFCDDTECKTSDNDQENNEDNCCPFQCLFKNTDSSSGEAKVFFLSKHLMNLVSVDFFKRFLVTPNILIKPLWKKARSPSPNLNLYSQNSILRI
jgi:hypothetical protein